MKENVNFVLVGQDPNNTLVESDDPAVRRREKMARAAAKARGEKPKGLESNVHMRVKLLKTQLLDLVPQHYEYVLYIDSDILLGQVRNVVFRFSCCCTFFRTRICANTSSPNSRSCRF